MVRTGVGVGGGDFESHTGGCSASATPRPGKDGGARRSSAGSAGASWGRFWAGVGEEDREDSPEEGRSDLDASPARQEDAGTEGTSRPREAMSLGGYIARAEELGGSLRHRRRTAFAPGGKVSRFRAGSAPRFTRLGDDEARRGERQRGGGRRGAAGVRPAWDGTAGSGGQPPPPESPRSVERAVLPGEEGSLPERAVVGPAGRCDGPDLGLVVEEQEHPLLLLGPPLVGPFGPQGGLVRSPPRQEEAQHAGPKWLWLPKGCTTPSLGFPARPSEVNRFHSSARTLFRLPEPPPLSRTFAEVVMERYGGEGSGGDGRNKRRFGGYGDGEARRQGAGRQDGGRQDLGRQDGRPELGRRDDGWQDGGRRGRFDDEPRPRYGEQRASDLERGDWGPPPPWWEWEQQRLREEEATRAKGHLQASAGGRGGNGGGGGGQAGRNNKKGGGQGAPPNPKNKGKNKAAAGGAAGAVGGECFRCGREGHFQSECTNAPVCVLCSREGHASANCPTRGRPMMLQQMGHAINGGGFYNIEVEPLEGSGQEEKFEAVIHFEGAPLLALQLADELKNLLDGSWDWGVAKVSEKEFSVRFPSRETLRMSTRRGKIYLPLSKMDVDIREAFVGPRPGKAMPPVWVQLTGLPGDLMERERLMAGLTMIGRPLDVDELSVKKWKTEPVRVRFQCRYPERIKGTIALCVNGVPFTVGVHAELGAPGAGGSNPPRPPPPGDDDDVDDLDSEDRSTDGERWNRHRKNDKAKGAAPPAGPGTGGSGGGSQRVATGGARSAPPLGRFSGQYGSNMGVLPALTLGTAGLESAYQEVTGVDVLGGCEGVSGEASADVLRGGLSASKALPVIEVEMEVGEEGEVEEEPLGLERPLPMTDLRSVVTAVAPLAQGKRTMTVPSMAPTKTIKKKALATPSRKSTRNLDPAVAGTDSDDFSILDARLDQQLGSVITDSCIIFVPSAGTPMEAISLLRAKEEAQAALARVAASQARELAAREARDAEVGDQTAAGEAAAPGSPDRPGPRCGAVLAADRRSGGGDLS
ncbi:hypothetical protein QYE76_065495 [Lolium multiflorum]|uniref:CCHC-type domain-containing protein n=1 Tax=Lolium multiflorum TaxID=4521 RepID=A0AAD8WA18_LOLMU|nr:hypothetical protein QYE76_065495 [Lolium multiflorum]